MSREWPHYFLEGMKILALFLAFSETTAFEVGIPCCFLSGVEIQAPHLAFIDEDGVRLQFFPRSLGGVRWLLSKSCLFCQAAPFIVLWLEGANFFWRLCCLCLLMFLGCQCVQLQVWDIQGKRKKKNLRNSPQYCSLGPEGCSSSASSFHLSDSFYICFTSDAQGFKAELIGRNR